MPPRNNSTREIEWKTNLERTRKFASEKNRWPSTTATDAVEKTLAQWFSRQKYYLGKFLRGEKGSGISSDRASEFKKLVDDYIQFERDSVWEHRYNLVSEKWKADQKLWSYDDADLEVQKTLRWFNQHVTFARKYKKGEKVGGMTDQRFVLIDGLCRVMGRNLDTEPDEDVQPSPPDLS
jgi:hypothetical protein